MRYTTYLLALLVVALTVVVAVELHHRPLVRDALATQPVGYLIDLNSADAATIALLPEVGPKLAATIVEYRDAHGGFTSVDDLRHIRGVGPRRMEAISPFVRCGPTTQRAP